MKKVARLEDILGQELANAHKYLYLLEQYVFQAIQVGEAADEAEEDLTEQKERVGHARHWDHDHHRDRPHHTFSRGVGCHSRW